MKACLFVFPLVPYLCIIASLQRAQGEKIGGGGAMSKVKCCKIAPIF